MTPFALDIYIVNSLRRHRVSLEKQTAGLFTVQYNKHNVTLQGKGEEGLLPIIHQIWSPKLGVTFS